MQKKKKKKKVIKGKGLEFKILPLRSLKKWEDNPRDNKIAVERLSQAIKDFGFINPIIVDTDLVIRAGHTRYEACKKLGIEEVPVIVVDFRNKTEAELYSIVDNKSAEWSFWDRAKLKEFFNKQKLGEEELAKATGFNIQEVKLFKEAIEEGSDLSIEQLTAEFKEAGGKQEIPERKYWLWFFCPDEETFNKVLELFKIEKSKRFGKFTKSGRQLDWAKLNKRLRIK